MRGVVYGFNRGGFDVLVEGVRVFCPASGMALGPVENPETVLGQRLEFTVPPAKAGTHGLVVSRRGILERQQRKAAKQLFRSLQPGQKLKGRVTQVREFGLFVDLGGFEGLVHSERALVQPRRASAGRGAARRRGRGAGLRVGEGQTRKERERVSLSMKTLQADPWSEHKLTLLEPGNIITGKVVRTTEFGAFIELARRSRACCTSRELGRELKHANQALKRAQEHPGRRRARRPQGASHLALQASAGRRKGTRVRRRPARARPPKPGPHLTVVVEKVELRGLIVQIPGVFGRRGRGFIPNAEMGTERGTDHRRGFPPGTQRPRQGRRRRPRWRLPLLAQGVSRSRKRSKAMQDYRREAARQGLGTFGDLLRAKLEGCKSNSEQQEFVARPLNAVLKRARCVRPAGQSRLSETGRLTQW